MKPVTTFILVLAFAAASGCERESAPKETDVRAQLMERGAAPLEPLPEQDEARVELGRLLFFDKELSGNRDVSCASCHHPSLATIDALPLGVGTGGVGLGPDRKLGEHRDIIPRNAPDLFNRADPLFTTMFWNNRIEASETGVIISPAGGYLPKSARTMFAAQAMFPVIARDEMRGAFHDVDIEGEDNELAKFRGNQPLKIWKALMDRVLRFEGYQEAFKKAFPDVEGEELTFEHAALAMSAFQSSAFHLTDSPWDRYMGGDDEALDAKALEGARLFYAEFQCSDCHSGRLLTDQKPHNLGVPQIGPGVGNSAPLDLGRAIETGRAEDEFRFRTPPLRNVELTGPYMHNGAFAELEDAIRHHFDPETSYDQYDVSQLPEHLQSTHQDDAATRARVFATLDARVSTPREVSPEQVESLIAFLKSLTSPSARPEELESVIPDSVPSGHEVERL